MDPKYVVVKNTRSMVNMLFKCSTGPLRIPKLPIKVKEPQVNDRANFCGFKAIVGNPTKNAKAKKSADRKSNAQKT